MAMDSIIPAALCLLLAGLVFLGRRPSTRWLLGGGLLVLGLEQFLAGWAAASIVPSQAIERQLIRSVAEAFLPLFWLAFSQNYGRALQRENLGLGRYLAVGATFAALLALLIPFGEFFEGLPALEDSAGGWLLPLGTRGYLFHVLMVLAFTSVVANLERTLRASLGRVRWQIKFAILGFGGYFAVRIYTASSAVLFRVWATSYETLHAWALVLAVILAVVALRRGGFLNVDIYVSQSALRGSITTLVVGAYLVGVGVLAHILNMIGWTAGMRDVLVFVALMSVLVVLLSDRARQDLRRLTRRHFRRPIHDYRMIWNRFSRGTADRLDENSVGRTLVSIVADALECLTVGLWTRDARHGSFRLVASTGLGEELASIDLQALASAAEKTEGIIDIGPPAGEEEPASPTRLERVVHTWASRKPQALTIVPLRRDSELIGIMAVTDRVRSKPLGFEDRELLEVLADETSALLMNIRLTRRLKEATEMEAFQHMSAFFLHDLKNLASRLSLTVQNFPKHQDNPEFRQEALRTMGQSVEKIRSICSRLSLVREKPDLERTPVELADWLGGVIEELRSEMGGETLAAGLEETGKVLIDRAQFRKVVVNLVLNAREAVVQKSRSDGNRKEAGRSQKQSARTVVPLQRGVPEGADVLVATRRVDGMLAVEVSDRGVGMEPGFVENRLFHPFQTTKKDGMGIGLFQSKMIVELHGGRVEVETEVNAGTTVRVLLPLENSQLPRGKSQRRMA